VHARLQMAFQGLFDVLQCVRPVGEVWLHTKYEGSSKSKSAANYLGYFSFELTWYYMKQSQEPKESTTPNHPSAD
jgi:hypothetical protein